MRFASGHRIIDRLKPRPKAVGMRSYLRARWRAKQGLGQWWHTSERRNPWQPKPNQTGGWLPGRHRWAGLQPMRRVIDPAVRYWPVTRQANEIIRYRRRRGDFPSPYLWAKRYPKRSKNKNADKSA